MCDHYNYNHQLYFNCCKKFYDCVHCHNKNSTHKSYPMNITKIKCLMCYTIQDPQQNCTKCKIKFSEYYCSKCKLFNNSSIYHCNKCNICYINHGKIMKHCDSCNKCYYESIFDIHNCNLKNNNPCQICLDDVKNSSQYFYTLKCSHNIHVNCYNEYKKKCIENKKIIGCCICKKSINIQKDTERIENIIKNDQKFIENNWKSDILCYDCYNNSTIDYHSKYLKCIHCNSYNTNQVKILK